MTIVTINQQPLVAVTEAPTYVQVSSDQPALVVEQQTVQLVAVAAQGPEGIPGSAVPVNRVAGETLSGHRAVRLTNGVAYYASADDLDHIGQTVGITTAAALVGETASIQTGNEMTYSGWTWADGPIWLGLNGQLTQTPPSSGVLQQVATATSSTTLLIDIQEPITRA